MFREPEDTLVAFGWPWHGLITDNELELPSGRKMACQHGGWDTQLWDVGLPDPEIEPDDPDEQWWPRSIVRAGVESGATSYGYFYSGSAEFWQYTICPIRIVGSDVVLRGPRLAANISNDPTRVVSLEFSSLPYSARVTFTRTQMGAPATISLEYASIIDSDFSRGQWLIRASTGSGRLIAIIRAWLVVVGGDEALMAEVVADYSECNQWVSVLDEPFRVPAASWLGWDVAAQAWVSEPDWPGTKPPPMFGFVAIGEYAAQAVGSLTVGAWFGAGGDVEFQRMWVDSEINYSCTNNPLQNYLSSETSIKDSRWLEYGEHATEALVFEFGDARLTDSGLVGTSVSGAAQVQGEVVKTVAVTGTGYSVNAPVSHGDVHAPAGSADIESGLAISAWLTNPVLGSVDVFNYTGVNVLSNKLVQPSCYVRVSGNEITWFGDVLSPHGVVPGTVVSRSVEGPTPLYIHKGTYNPITGQVVRNPTDGRRYSWV